MENSQYDILIVDDSKFIIELLSKIIQLKGYTFKAVDRFSKAKSELANNQPKLIFLDVNLPDSNGYEFCRKLKSKVKFKNTLIYYFTGMPESEVALKALETKADGYLTKPFDLSDFDDIFVHLDQNATV